MKTKLLPLALAINGAVLAMASVGVHAADAPASKPAVSGIEEVIITARKTEESAQAVPVSVTALSAEALTKNAITNIRDVHVPGLYITSDTQGGQATFAIRAAKQGNGTSDTVTAYVGDMPVVSNISITHMMYDMASISVLKGPQGTLFGANSTGGAIIFRPNQPTNNFEGYAELGIADYDQQSFQGMVNLPVNDVLQVRIAGEVVDRSKGFTKNHRPPAGLYPLPNTATELNTDKHESARIGVRLKPSDAWEHNFTFDYYHENDQNQPEIVVERLPRFTFGGFATVDYSKFGGQIDGDPKNVMLGGINVGTGRKNKIWTGQWVADYNISDDASFKSVLAYQDAHLWISTDNDVSAWSIVNGSTEQWIKQWTWEPSVDWKTLDGRLRNKTGLFFSTRDWKWGNSYSLLGLPYDFGIPPAQTSFLPLPYTGHHFYQRKFQSHAIYTQFSYDLTKELTATLGMRYSWDKGTYRAKDNESPGMANLGTQGNYHYFGATDYCTTYDPGYENANLANCTWGAKLKSQAPSFSFTLEDKYDENSMVYATLRGGYLLGGFNNQVPKSAAALGLFPQFQPEKVVDFETGVKSDWSLWNRPIRTNLAVFYGNYKNQQRFQNGNVGGVSIIGTMNAGASTFYGFDLDVTYEPTDNLELSGSWNHLESEYSSFKSFISGAATINGITALPSTLDLSGTTLGQAPQDVINLSATYKWPLSSDVGRVSSTLSYYWTDKTASQDTPTRGCATVNASGGCSNFSPVLDFSRHDMLPAYDIWNFSTQWKNIMGSNFDANFWVKNLTDKKYWTSVSNQMLVFGYMARIYGDPRTMGVNLRYNF